VGGLRRCSVDAVELSKLGNIGRGIDLQAIQKRRTHGSEDVERVEPNAFYTKRSISQKYLVEPGCRWTRIFKNKKNPILKFQIKYAFIFKAKYDCM
jgi:hypothetical protein